MPTVHTCYSRIVANIIGDIGQRALYQNDLGSLETRLEEFKRMLVEKFVKKFESGLYALKYHHLDYLLHDIQRFGTLST